MSEEPESNLSELTEGSPNEEKCRAYLEGLRWPDGIKCPRCGSSKISRIKTRDQLDCDPCRYRFSVTAGTIFHDTHLPLWKWFAAINLIVESDEEVSASQIKRTIGVSYKTAWHLRYRIRDTLVEADALLLVSTIEAAGTSVSGGTEGEGRGHWASDAAAGADADTETFCAGEWPGNNRYKGWGKDAGGNLGSADTSWSLSNPGIAGLPKVGDDEHLDALLNALTLYYDRQQNPPTFREVMRKLLTVGTLPYKKLMDKRKG